MPSVLSNCNDTSKIKIEQTIHSQKKNPREILIKFDKHLLSRITFVRNTFSIIVGCFKCFGQEQMKISRMIYLN